ncbi:hypothetical protein ACHAXA_002494 [Cyclostephanos tholiformis]|uniref:Abscisic acid G-protein coupled receptor-like domain-containing protein n=1 Tax=Cyclostephanos tholiformis TaxID=382380 RepID=A0ABD3RA93_9STRA
MLDIVVFGIAVAITKRIADKHPLLPSFASSSSSPSMRISAAPTRRRRNGNDYHDDDDDDDDVPPHPSRTTRRIFRFTLLISLLLLSLSILEASPPNWLVVVTTTTAATATTTQNGRDIVGRRSDDDASSTFAYACTFVAWYRALLWTMCTTLLVAHPLSLCAVVASALLRMVVRIMQPFSSRLLFAGGGKSTISSRSPPIPSSTRTRRARVTDHRAIGPMLLCWTVLRIGIRFVLVTLLWRLILRGMLRAVIPHRITRRAAEGDGANGGGGGNGGHGPRHRRSCIAIGIIGSIVALMATTMTSVFYPPPPSSSSTSPIIPSLATLVSTLCFVGTVVASVLNGFGCASLPHANLVGMLLESTPPGLMSKVEGDLDYAIKVLEEKRWQLADIATHQRPQSWYTMSSSSSSSSSSSFVSLSPTATAMTTAEIRKARKKLEEDIVYLTNLVGDMEDDLGEMKSSSLLALEARTAVGRVRGILGVVFSLVLIVRVIFAAASLLGPINRGDHRNDDSTRHRDPLTSLLLLLVGHNYIVSEEQYERWSQVTSLVLAGALTTTQVSSFFRVIGALGRRLSGIFAGYAPSLRIAGVVEVANDLAVLTSSFMMGCYFLACVTVIKTSLPIEYRRSFSTAVGSSNFSYVNNNDHARLINMIFFASSCISAITLASLFGIQRNNSDRYRNEFSRLLDCSTSSLHSLA